MYGNQNIMWKLKLGESRNDIWAEVIDLFASEYEDDQNDNLNITL